jgi:hypothetical protein
MLGTQRKAPHIATGLDRTDESAEIHASAFLRHFSRHSPRRRLRIFSIPSMLGRAGMDWYIVIKAIKGRRYRYRQKTWREAGRVRTSSEYIGPAGQAPIHRVPKGATAPPLPVTVARLPSFDPSSAPDAL